MIWQFKERRRRRERSAERSLFVRQLHRLELFFLIKFVQPELSCYILITIVQLCFPIDLMGEREGGDEEHMPTTHSFPETYNYET